MDLNKIYCINLNSNSERWKRFLEIDKQIRELYSINIERIEAVDARTNPQACLDLYGLVLSPFTISIGLYFYYCSSAIGCFLSHYKIWQKIVTEKIPYAMIIEDDISTVALVDFLARKDVSYKKFDVIQLTQRAAPTKNYVFFHGSESYILSIFGAQKLLEAVKTPSLLQHITNYEESLSIIRYYESYNMPIPKMELSKLPANAIVAPSDQIFSLCCHPKCHDDIRLNYKIMKHISLDSTHSKASDIGGIVPGIQPWNARKSDVECYLASMQNGHLFKHV